MAELPPDWTRLLSLAVHELRSPVNVAGGYVRMLGDQRNGPLTERQQRLVERAQDSWSRTAALLADLSDLAKLEAGTLTLPVQLFDLDLLLDEVVTASAAADASGIAIERRGTASGRVAGDRERLRRALSVCITIVAREAVEGSRLVIEVRPGATAGHVWIRFAEHELLTALPSSDEGWGPLDEWRGGLGLELPLAHRVVGHAGGRLLSPIGASRQVAVRLELPCTP